MRRIAVVIACFAPVAAFAEPGNIEIKDRGDAVEVIAHDIKAARTAIIPIRSRLEVPIVGHPTVSRVTPGDATVHLVELDSDDGKAALSVKLNFERPDVKTLARYAQAIQVGDDLHVIVPRAVPAEGATIKLPEPTLPPAVAASLAAPSPSKIDMPKPAVAPLPAKQPADAKAAAIAPPAHTVEPEQPTTQPSKPVQPAPVSGLADDPDDPWTHASTWAVLGLAAVGAGVWLVRRRRRTTHAPLSTIEVLAQRSLGGKARVVWLTAGPREMVVAVTPQNVRMLGQWRKADGPAAALPMAQLNFDAPQARMPRAITQMEKPSSPAVAGLIRLRAQTAPPINDDVATGDIDADSLWAKEILAATGGRR